MKRRLLVSFILIVALLTIYITVFLELKYNVNLFQYLQFSSDYTEEETAILARYQPLIYGGNINEPPLGNYYEDNGQYIGLVVDYTNAISIELGVPIISEPMVWNHALDALKEGRTNLCDMVPSKERSQFFAFSNPIYKLRGVIVVKDPTIIQLKDLEGLTVAMQKGDYALEHISETNKIHLTYTNDLDEALTLLHNDQVDAVIGDEPVIRYLLNELSYVNNYRILEKPLYEASCSFAVPKSQAELIPVINKAIFSMQVNGTLAKIERKWSGHYTSFLDEKEAVNKMYLNVAALIILVLLIGYMVFLWNRSLKLLVDSRTNELNIMKNELQVTFDGIDDFLVVVGQDLKIKNINLSFIQYQGIEKKLIIDDLYTNVTLLCDFDRQYSSLLLNLLTSSHSLLSFDAQTDYEFKSKLSLFKATIYPLEEDTTNASSILIMISDVTHTRLEEQKLIHSNKMETIGQLAAGVAHELRTPLGVIRNSTFILNKETQKNNESDELKAMALQSINNSVSRASTIIENLLKFSRLTQDECRWINVEQSIHDAIDLNRKRLEEQIIDLSILCDRSMQIFINDAALQHILMNLIQNAIDSMPNGGKLKICCYKEASSVIINVEDTGIGIEDEKIDKIFDPFYTTKPVGKGTGLGLYIAYSEVQKFGGKIKVFSEMNKGTVFSIIIPDRSEKR